MMVFFGGVKLLPLLFLFLYNGYDPPAPGLAQQEEYYPYYAQDTSRLQQLASAHRDQLKNAFADPVGVSDEYRKKYTSIVHSNAQEIYSSIRHSALLDPVIDPYIQKVFRRVMEANPDLPPSRLILTRSPIENAYALGDGTILFNIGLLAKLENESQVAFILCHELAHTYFRHGQTGLKERLDVLFSREFRKEYKKVVKEEYNRHSKMESLVMKVSLNSLYHRRGHEKQADSLGYVLLARTSFDASQAYTALRLLDRIKEPYTSEAIDLPKFFGCPEYSRVFEAKPAKTTSIFDISAKQEEQWAAGDTLLTHPDCQKRMGYMQVLARSHPQKKVQEIPDPVVFAMVKAHCRREVVQSWFDLKRYDYSFHTALLLLQEQPHSRYLHAMVMLNLYQFREHLQAHRFSEVVSAPRERDPESLGQVLSFLHALHTSDVKGLSGCFNPLLQQALPPNEYGVAAQYAYAVMQNDRAGAEEYQKQYSRNHKGGKFESLLSSPPPK